MNDFKPDATVVDANIAGWLLSLQNGEN